MGRGWCSGVIRKHRGGLAGEARGRETLESSLATLFLNQEMKR